jgi:hypothetical protein
MVNMEYFKIKILPWILILLGATSAGVSSARVAYKAATAEGCDVILVAPSEARVGQLIVLDASASNAKTFKWSVQSDNNFMTIEDGRKAVFSAEKAGSFQFIVAGALDNTVDLEVVTITVAGPLPPPDPPSGLEGKIKTWYSTVDSKQKKAEAAALSTSFKSVAELINQKILKTPEDVIRSTAVSNRAAIGPLAGIQWQPFSDGLRAELNARSERGDLSTMDSHAATWLEISRALEKASRE